MLTQAIGIRDARMVCKPLDPFFEAYPVCLFLKSLSTFDSVEGRWRFWMHKSAIRRRGGYWDVPLRTHAVRCDPLLMPQAARM